jgi:hypothetical protein
MTAASLRTIQRAAIDRAVTGDADPARQIAFAGALEAARDERGPGDVLGAALVSTVAARALDAHERRPRTDASPWTPRAGTEPDPWLVEGAVLAHRLTDLDVEAVARLADLPVAELETALADREPLEDPDAGAGE